MKHQESAGAVIYYYDEKAKEPVFLLLKYTNYWGFAKGIIEEGEEVKDTVKREVKEETDLDIEILPKFNHQQKWFFRQEGELISKEAIYLIGKVTKEQADKTKISHEHEDFKWLTQDKALKFIKIKNNKQMLAAAHKFILNYEKQKKLK